MNRKDSGWRGRKMTTFEEKKAINAYSRRHHGLFPSHMTYCLCEPETQIMNGGAQTFVFSLETISMLYKGLKFSWNYIVLLTKAAMRVWSPNTNEKVEQNYEFCIKRGYSWLCKTEKLSRPQVQSHKVLFLKLQVKCDKTEQTSKSFLKDLLKK